MNLVSEQSLLVGWEGLARQELEDFLYLDRGVGYVGACLSGLLQLYT